MHLFFSDDPIPEVVTKSIFLAGPSPRTKNEKEWRKEAIELLKKYNFDGEVFIPCPRHVFHDTPTSNEWNYDNQINWEVTHRHIANKILFWMPRKIQENMPAFTTNIEFGEDLNSGKIVYGRPDDAEKIRYLDQRVEELNLKIYNNLEEQIKDTVQDLNNGAKRFLGEVYVPLHIWKTEMFQSWYQSHKNNQNKLLFAQVLSTFQVKQTVFSFALKVHVWIESEQRIKDNEFVFSRKDISSVFAYYKEAKETYIVLVSEFRSPVSNKEGKVIELAGGSSFKSNTDPKENAQKELYEETGVLIENKERFSFVNSRQLVSTLCSHKSYLYKVELNKNEFDFLLKNADVVYGEIEDTERTTVRIVKLSDLFKLGLDYSMLGMIFEALNQ